MLFHESWSEVVLMMNQLEIKLWVNESKVKETRLEFLINNSLSKSNNFKIQHVTLKVEETWYCTKFLFSIIKSIFRTQSNI